MSRYETGVMIINIRELSRFQAPLSQYRLCCKGIIDRACRSTVQAGHKGSRVIVVEEQTRGSSTLEPRRLDRQYTARPALQRGSGLPSLDIAHGMYADEQHIRRYARLIDGEKYYG